jgi:SAM-dependent methyltransferase
MMFGTRERFEYIECAACGTLQIAEVPDLARHYPADYYSLAETGTPLIAENWRRRLLARLAGRFFRNGFVPLMAYLIRHREWLEKEFPPSLREPMLGLRPDSAILDFGCGNGRLLRALRLYGFNDLTGADAFIERDLEFPDGVRVLKQGLGEIERKFDLVMLHHSFEHLPDPESSLRGIRELIAPGGFCLIRIPLKAEAWNRYGVDWFQLDAPRHLFLFTESSFRDLAGKCGLKTAKVVYDSGPAQFWISEQYSRDIPMHDPRAFAGDYSNAVFGPEQMSGWEALAEEVNRTGRGDQACFYLVADQAPE